MPPTLHIVMPVFNEQRTFGPCVDRVLAAPLPPGWSRKLIVVDDCSDEPARLAVRDSIDHHSRCGAAIVLREHATNMGKGAALQTGFDLILADPSARDDDLVTIQDADLEYDPRDYQQLMQPVLDDLADAVLGTRWGRHRAVRGIGGRIHAAGNALLTALSNMMTGFHVSDMECCYKLMPIAILRRVRPALTEQRFGIEPQLVAAFARLRLRISEVPVQYQPRGPNSGKKIGIRDGIRALWVIARERR